MSQFIVYQSNKVVYVFVTIK